MVKNKIIVIVGPTGVGKTKLSIALAKTFNGEIINADSMQVYKGLDIGTAKVTGEEKENIPHHLFDICDVNEEYNVYCYQRDVRLKINEILSKDKTPIIVGGTGLYIKAGLFNYQFSDEGNHCNYDDLSNQEIYDKLVNKSVHLNNRKRLVRELQKQENNCVNTNKGNELLYDAIFIGLTSDRKKLYQIIDERVDHMIQVGLLDEVKKLYDNNIHTRSVMTAIGYKELYEYFNNNLSLSESIDLIKKNSRHYAKRQYTFFNHQLPINWFNVNYDNFKETIDEVIKKINE